MKKILFVLVVILFSSVSKGFSYTYYVSDSRSFAQALTDVWEDSTIYLMKDILTTEDYEYYTYTNRPSTLLVDGQRFSFEAAFAGCIPYGFIFDGAGLTIFKDISIKGLRPYDRYNGEAAITLINSSFATEGYINFLQNMGQFGGAMNISNNSVVTFNEGVINFEGNYAYGNGGALYIENSKVNFNNSAVRFYDNFSLTTSYIENFCVYGGGAIYASSTVLTFISCDVEILLGVAYSVLNEFSDCGGGAIYADNNSILTLKNGKLNIMSSSADSSEAGEFGGQGGGIYLLESLASFENMESFFMSNTARYGGGIYMKNSDVYFKNGIVKFGNAAHIGGGVYLSNSNLKFDNIKTNFIANRVENIGGAVYSDDSIMEFIGGTATFSDNIAKNSGGAIYITEGSTISFTNGNTSFDSNESLSCGGAVHANAGHLMFSGGETTFQNNKSTAMNSFGGAIYAENNSKIDFDGGIVDFTSNSATNGGAIYADNSKIDFKNTKTYFNGNDAIDFGGAVCLVSSTFTVDSSTVTFFGNSTMLDGGAINASKNSYIKFTNSDINFLNNTSKYSFYGGAVYLSGSKLDFVNARINFFDNISTDAGGAMYVGEKSSVNFTNSSTLFESNIALSKGGALYVSSATATFTNSTTTFRNNKSTDTNSYGGAIYADNNSVINFDSGEVNFIGNNAANGGAIYITGGSTVSFTNNQTTFNSNESLGYGGALYARSSDLTFTSDSVEFINNYSDYGGGAIFAYENASVNFDKTNLVFKLNKSIRSMNDGGAHGGALLAYKNSEIIFNNCDWILFDSNRTLGYGGAIRTGKNSYIYFNDSKVTFSNNSAVNGGAIYSNDSNIYFDGKNIKFDSNISYENGGAIHAVNDSRIRFNNIDTIEFSNNSGKYGAAIYVGDSQMSFYKSTYNLFESNISTTSKTIFDVDSSLITFFESGVVFNSNGSDKTESIYNVKNSTVSFRVSPVYFENNDAFSTVLLTNSIMQFNYGSLNFINNTHKNGALNIENSNISFMSTNINFYSNTSPGGSAVNLINKSSFYFQNEKCKFYDNKSIDVSGSGGAISISDSWASFLRLRIYDYKDQNSSVAFEKNIAGLYGGAIYAELESDIDFDMYRVDFKENKASFGGAIYSNDSNISFYQGNILFMNNEALHGAAYFVYSSSLTAEGCNTIFKENTAKMEGGAIKVELGSVINFTKGGGTVSGLSAKSNLNAKNSPYSEMVSFENNSAGGSGGAIFSKDSELNFSEGIVSFNGNSAENGSGGGIFTQDTAMTFKNALIMFKNNRSLFGGAVYADSGSDVNFEEKNILTFEGNSAAEKGGAVYLNGGKMSLTADITEILFRNNKAAGMPNDVYADINSTLDLNAADYGIRFEGGILTDNSGTGININKSGSGTLYLGGNNEIWGNFNVSGGDIALLADATFKGKELILPSGSSLDLQNDSVNTIELERLEISDSLKVDVFYDGASDKITAGNISVDGTLDINAGVGTYDNKEFEIIIATENAINGAFSDVVINNNGLSFNLDPLSNIIKLTLDGSFGSDFSSGRLKKLAFNQKETARVLDSLSTVSTGELNSVISNALSLSDAEQKVFLSQVSGYFLANVIRGALSVSENKEIFGRISGGNKYDRDDNVWIQVNAEYTRYKEDENSLGDYKDISAGLTAGYEKYFSDNRFVAGAYGKYNGHSIDQSPKNEADISNIGIGFYGGYIKEKFEIKALLSGSYDSYDTSRYIRTTNKTANGSFDGMTFAADIEGVLKIEIKNSFLLTPYAGLEVQNTNYKSFKESGAGDLNLHVDGNDYTRSAGRAGIGIGYEAESKKWNAYAKGESKYLFNGDSVQIDSAFAGTDEKFTSRGYTEDGFIFGLGLGGSVNIFKQGDIFLNTGYFGGDGYDNIYGNLGVKYSF